MSDAMLTNQLAFSGAVVWVLQALKRSPYFGWVTADTDKINRALSVSAAFFGSLGLQVVAVGDFAAGGTITITVPRAAELGAVLGSFIAQLTLQEALYRGVVKTGTK